MAGGFPNRSRARHRPSVSEKTCRVDRWRAIALHLLPGVLRKRRKLIPPLDSATEKVQIILGIQDTHTIITFKAFGAG
jgi:hypothetical protein